MCPPGYFIQELSTRGGSLVDRIDHMICENPDNGHRTFRSVNGTIGSGFGGSLRTLSCPAGQYIAGMMSQVGWLTDGFAVRCRAED
jgi:hypothetical protein